MGDAGICRAEVANVRFTEDKQNPFDQMENEIAEQSSSPKSMQASSLPELVFHQKSKILGPLSQAPLKAHIYVGHTLKGHIYDLEMFLHNTVPLVRQKTFSCLLVSKATLQSVANGALTPRSVVPPMGLQESQILPMTFANVAPQNIQEEQSDHCCIIIVTTTTTMLSSPSQRHYAVRKTLG
ncbi:Star-Related Lipid Transfer Protein 6 [Manis pentadactyla]|nr:Star-Related Lipid Transfer Protein 6 [Manis pentadactyla]